MLTCVAEVHGSTVAELAREGPELVPTVAVGGGAAVWDGYRAGEIGGQGL